MLILCTPKHLLHDTRKANILIILSLTFLVFQSLGNLSTRKLLSWDILKRSKNWFSILVQNNLVYIIFIYYSSFTTYYNYYTEPSSYGQGKVKEKSRASVATSRPQNQALPIRWQERIFVGGQRFLSGFGRLLQAPEFLNRPSPPLSLSLHERTQAL